MKYFKVYTKDNITKCYIATVLNIAPEELCERMGCPDYRAVQITEQHYEDFINSKYNSWDLKEYG